jgi:hypothetical protein
MKLYAVFQEGACRHSCFGIFNSELKAIETACKAEQEDQDDYHEYTVVPFTLNKQVPFDNEKQYAKENKAIYSTKNKPK